MSFNILLDGFNIRNRVAHGPIAAAASAIGTVKNAFGKDKGSYATPSQQQTLQGYAAMPKYLQDIYENQFTPAVMEYFNSEQGKNPNQIVPFNQTQQNALSGFGQNINQINTGLQDYANPYNQFVTDQIKRNYGAQQNNLLGGANKMGGVGALKSSSLGTQLSLNNEAMQRALAEAQYNSYKEAMGLRRQTLADMLEAGMLEQQQQQAQLNAQNQNPLSRVRNLGELLGLIPGSNISTTTGGLDARKPQPNRWQRAGGAFNEINNAVESGAFDRLYNNGSPRAGSYGAPAPGIFNKMFGI